MSHKNISERELRNIRFNIGKIDLCRAAASSLSTTFKFSFYPVKLVCGEEEIILKDIHYKLPA